MMYMSESLVAIDEHGELWLFYGRASRRLGIDISFSNGNPVIY